VSVAHRFPCNALTTKSDVDCSCGALTPQECAALSTREATCVHGRPGGHLCPHCLGINSAFEEDIQLISDALQMRCRRCDGAHLTIKNEEPIPGIPIPILSYACRTCGLDSTKKVVKVELTTAELDIICLGLQQLKGQYPKVAPLIDHLDGMHEVPA
jgi:hypothetical protein